MIKVLGNVILVRASSRLVDSWQLIMLPHGKATHLSSGCGQGKVGKVSSLVSFLIKTLILFNKGPTIITLFDIRYFPRGLRAKHSYLHWGC